MVRTISPLLELRVGAVDANIKRLTTYCVSYANSRSFGPLDPYIDAIYLVADPDASQIVCEISCINHAFFLSITRDFADRAFIEALQQELKDAGIQPVLQHEERLALGGMSLEGLDVFDLGVTAVSTLLGFFSDLQ